MTKKRITAIKKSKFFKALYTVLFELIRSMVHHDPKQRPTAAQVLENEFFNPQKLLSKPITGSQALPFGSQASVNGSSAMPSPATKNRKEIEDFDSTQKFRRPQIPSTVNEGKNVPFFLDIYYIIRFVY